MDENVVMTYSRRIDSFKYSYLEWMVIAALPLLFVFAADISPLPNHDYSRRVAVANLVCIALFLLCVFQAVRRYRSIGRRIRLSHYLSSNWGSFVAGAIVFMSRCITAADSPLYWDTTTYLVWIDDACRSFDYSLASLLKFQMAGHVSYGYSLILSIGRFLTPGSTLGMNIVNALLVSLAVSASIDLIGKILSIKDQVRLFAIGLIIGFEPMTLGIFGSTNTEWPLLAYSVFLAWAHSHDLVVSAVFFTLLLILSKESGLIITAAYVFFCVVFYACQAKRSFGRYTPRYHLRTYLSDRCATSIMLAFLISSLGLLWYLFGMSGGWGGSSALSIGNNEVGQNFFGLRLGYASKMLLVTILHNGAWLPLVTVCVTTMLIFARRLMGDNLGGAYNHSGKPWSCLPQFAYLFSMLLLMLFNMFYITVPEPRYALAPRFCLLSCSCCLVLFFLKNRKVIFCFIISTLAIAFFCLCALGPFDPITNLVYPPVKFGRSEMTYHPALLRYPEYWPDTLGYNRQFFFREQEIERLLQGVNYQDGDVFITWETDEWQVIFSSLDGKAPETTMGLRWDPFQRKRVLSDASDKSVGIICLDRSQALNYLRSEFDGSSRVFLVVDAQFTSSDEINDAFSTIGNYCTFSEPMPLDEHLFTVYEVFKK